MEQKVYNLIIIYFLTIVSIHDVSSSNPNFYTITTTIDIDSTSDKITDQSWLQPLNTTISIYQDSTTYLPTSTNIQTKEILDSSETNVLNRFVHPSYQRKEDNDPSDYAIPYSEHEDARDVATQPKYTAPGIWAKPPPEKNIPLNFVPTKLHAQVRGTHTVKRLPQQQAIESAETDEEIFNAPRLREVVTNSKVNTIYTEEGYEDSAYDHAGHIRDADFHEGFARKLHDQRKSGKKKQKKNLVPDEFKEYEEDYHDHLQENRKFKDGETDEENDEDENDRVRYDKNSWENSEINPKFIAETNIQKLEQDVEQDAEKAEKNSEIYQNVQESKLRNDIKNNNSELENSHTEDNLEYEDKSIEMKKKKSKLQNNNISKKKKQPRKLEQKKKLHLENYETTVLPLKKTNLIDVETLTDSQNFVMNPPNSQIYSIDQTTVRYVTPITTSLRQVDKPTTISYSQLFWDYFKARQDLSTTESSTFVSNSTTMNPQKEVRTPIAVATIDGHGPYLLVTKEETTTPSSTFLDSRSFYSQNLFSDRVDFAPISVQQPSYPFGQNNDVEYVDNMVATSTISTFTSVPLNSKGVEYSSSTTVLDTTLSSSTPTIMTLNFTQEAYARIADYHENPFLSPILENNNIAVTRNKLKYKVLARAKPSRNKKLVKSVTQLPYQQVSPPISKEERRVRNELDAKYNKMLNYIKNKQEAQSSPKEKKIFLSENFISKKPPIQQASYSTSLVNHPSAINRSSISTESKSFQEANWRSKMQNQHPPHPLKLPVYFNPFSYVQSMHPVYHKNLFPTTKLLPPPLPNTYVNYRSNKQNNNHYFYPDSKPQQWRDKSFKYLPSNLDANWRTQSRRKRSNEGKFRDHDSNAMDVNVKAVANNSVTDGNKSQQDKDTFDREIDGLKGKLKRRIINVSGTTKLFPTRLKENESGTYKSRNNSTTNGEKENIKDARDIVIDISEKLTLIRSAEQNEPINKQDVKLAKKKRDVENKKHLKKNLTKDHEELLNESPKISDSVIDKEIATRFNKKDNETLKTKSEEVEIEVPNFDHIEELVKNDQNLLTTFSTTTEAVIDLRKYPFYNDKDVPSASALKYIVDPRMIPRKTSHGMEFYDSRNAYKQCDEVEPSLDEVLPEKEEPDSERGPQEDLPRLRGLGDKLDCFKAKYFDENPLDNPLFAEKLVEQPTPPTEINPQKFASKIMVLPEENDEYVVPQISKKPERSSRQWRNRIRPYENLESIRVNYKYDPQTGKGRNAHLHTVRGTMLSNIMRRMKNRKSGPKVSTTTRSSKLNKNDSYQNQVYEDVMGNIRNMKNGYQVYELTTLPSPTQVSATTNSEDILKIADDTSKKQNITKLNVIDIAINNTKSSEIKGLVPPPKYYRQNYRKYRPLAKNRAAFIRSPTFPRIIAHHRTIKLNKRSTTDNNTKNFTANKIHDKLPEETAVNGSVEIDTTGNDTLIVKLIEKTVNITNVTSEPNLFDKDLQPEESKPIGIQDQSLSTSLKINDKKKRRNSTNSDLESKPQKAVYTIRDRVRYSKSKLNTRGFGKFVANSEATNEGTRRKEPRYNHISRKKKLVNDQQNNPIINSTENTSGIDNATSLIEDRESSTTEIYQAEESAVQQLNYHKKDGYPEKVKNINTKSEEDFLEEDEKESSTNTYQVHETVNEKISTTTTRSTTFQDSKEVSDLREYLKSDPPGYAETFSEETTTPLSEYHANASHESEDNEEKQEEETDYSRNPWDNESSEKVEEQIEMPAKTKFLQNDDSEELSSEKEDSNKDITTSTHKKRPLLSENDKDDEEKTFYKPFPFSRYKSMFKKESDENNSEEESEEKNEDYVFPWHADKEDKKDKRKWLHSFDRYEYPWEKRERLARERQKRRRIKPRTFDDEYQEESVRHERPIYPWEKYDVPSKIHKTNIRRDISRRYIDDSEESSTEYVPLTKYSSRYSSSDADPLKFSNAREISRSIKKFLEEDNESEEKTSKEIENHPPFVEKSLSSSDKKTFRGIVPEDITQPPKRRKISRIDKNLDNSRFDSKKLNSKEITNKETEEESVEYLKLNKSHLNNSELLTKVASKEPSRLSDETKETSPMTKQHKKRRRRILKDNFTVLGNASSTSTQKPIKKKRRKSEVSTTTSSTSTDFDLNTSTPIQQKYSKKNKKLNKSNFSEQTTTPKTTKNNFQDTSTPKTRTIEHRSRISKEKIITKTTYPNETENFDFEKKSQPVREEPIKLRIKSRRGINNKQDGNNTNLYDKKDLIKQEDEEENYKNKFINEDQIKESVILNKLINKGRNNTLDFGIKKDEIKKINDFDTNDGIVNNENDKDNNNFGISEIYAVRNLQNVLPNREKNGINDKRDNVSNTTEDWKEQNNSTEASKEEKENVEQKPLLQAKFIKDPERRLYYYIEH